MKIFKPITLLFLYFLSSFSIYSQIEIQENDYVLKYIDNKINIRFKDSFSSPIVKVFDVINNSEVSVNNDITGTNSFALNNLSSKAIYKIEYTSSTNRSVLKTNYIAPISASTGDIKVFFNHPVDTNFSQTQAAVNLSNTLDDKLIEYINACVSTLDIAIYSSASPSSTSGIAGAINAAYTRGVQVRIIHDGTASNIISLLNSAIPVIASPTTAAYTIMHNKFVVFDANNSNANLPLVWTGSTNWTVAQIDGPDKNNAIVIQDQSLALAYQIEFNEMWGSNTMVPNATLSKFGSFKTDNTPHNFIIGGKKVESYFSPSDGVNAKIIATINSANSDVNIATMDITRTDITTALLNKYNSGLTDINVVIDSQNPSGNQITAIKTGILPNHAVVYNGTGIMHHKFMVVDNFDASSDPQVLLGSHNWSTAAETKNDENTLIVHDANIANQYYQAFAYIYQLSGGVLLHNLSTSSNEKLQFSDLVIYPNPSNGLFVIENRGLNDLDKVTLTVSNVLGETVFFKKYETLAREVLDISTQEKGVYFIQVADDNDFKTFKVIIK